MASICEVRRPHATLLPSTKGGVDRSATMQGGPGGLAHLVDSSAVAMEIAIGQGAGVRRFGA